MDTYDVVVIGGGPAGVAAALSAVRAGARVALVRNGPGAAALSRGGWLTAPPPAIRDALADAGLALLECDGALPHPDGVLVRCELAGGSHARAAIGAGAHDVVVCGIAGLPSFRASALAELWSDEAGLPNGSVQAVTVTLDGTPAAGWSPVSLAARLDREPELLGAAVADSVREASRSGGAGVTRAIVPAVLGLKDHARVSAAVQEAAGVSTGEALGVSPSVPGWRLDQALQRAVANAGVSVIGGAVVTADVRDRIVQSITVDGSDGSDRLAASCFVLATGKYIGGGITAEKEFEECALGCDVALERFARTIDDPGAALMLTDPVRTEPQPVLSAGVRADAEGRPLDASGDVFLSNVFVAGSVRAGVETAALGLGAAAQDGWAAGEHAAAMSAGG